MGILCQGRGSAANSAVCYCLGITAVDPNEIDVLFERFLSNARNEPPDIDVDFEHERREEIIQWIYERIGPRPRRSRRHGDRLSQPQRHPRCRQGAGPVARHGGRDGRHGLGHRGRAASTSSMCAKPASIPPIRVSSLALELSATLSGFPRHLSQHVGGFVLTETGSTSWCRSRMRRWKIAPSSNGTRTISTRSGIYKVDVLALGMLTACARASP